MCRYTLPYRSQQTNIEYDLNQHSRRTRTKYNTEYIIVSEKNGIFVWSETDEPQSTIINLLTMMRVTSDNILRGC